MHIHKEEIDYLHDQNATENSKLHKKTQKTNKKKTQVLSTLQKF